MITPPVFLDANVFMYAAGAAHQYKAQCVRILADVEAGALPAAIDTEILQEILYRYSHIGLAEKGVSLCREILKYPLVDLPVTDADIRLAVDLFDAHRATGMRPRDAVHAATMRNNGITQVISADGHFDHFSFITRIDPLAYITSS